MNIISMGKMASSNRRSTSPKDFVEYMASFENLNNVVVNIDSSSDASGDEVKIVNELVGTHTNHRCDLCCEGEFLIDKLLRFGGLINDKYKFVCDKCDKNFVYRSELTKHVPDCSGPVYKTNNDVSLIAEKTSALKKCPNCSKSFKSKGGFTKHMQSQHSGLTHTCEICKQVFSSFEQFRMHCMEHQRQRSSYLCQICDKRFRWKTSLQKHQRKTHYSQ